MTIFHPGLLVGASLLVLGACASVPDSNIGGVPDRKIAAMTDAELSAHRAQRIARTQRLTQERLDAYLSGETVTVSGDGLSYSIQWMKLAGMINIRVVAASSEFGILSQGTITLAADAHGRPVMGGGVPVILTANSASMEANGRFFAGGIMNMMGAAANGAVAAQIRANNTCTENCGSPIINQVQAAAQSASRAIGTGSANASSGRGCPSGGCGSDAFDF